jgi:hypothetical protein
VDVRRYRYSRHEFDDIDFECRLVQEWDTKKARFFRMSPSWHPPWAC